MRKTLTRLARLTGIAMVLAAYALAEAIAPTAAHAGPAMRVTADTFYCDRLADVVTASRQIVEGDYAGYLRTVDGPNCGMAPTGTDVEVTNLLGDHVAQVTIRAAGYQANVFMLAAMLGRPVDSTVILSQMAMICRTIEDLSQVADALRAQDGMAIQAKVDFQQCALLQEGSAVTVRTMGDRVAQVEAPVAGQVFRGFIAARDLR